MTTDKASLVNGGELYSPLISFYTLFDMDCGLLYFLINSKYCNEEVFDRHITTTQYETLAGMLYYRQFENPLVILAKEDSDFDDFDDYYKQFFERYEMDIYKNSPLTTMYDFLESIYNYNKDIKPVILCFNDTQVEMVKLIGLYKEFGILRVNDIHSESDLDIHGQFYFKDVEELKLINGYDKLTSRTFYFSTFGLNFMEDRTTFKDMELMEIIAMNRNQVFVFDMFDRNDIVDPYSVAVENIRSEENE